ncbi:MAG: DNA-processing protein DprA [Lachnospiraceae bacterium]|nr:DNA-processing protein DprA [Lachnospiraceae bacterium]
MEDDIKYDYWWAGMPRCYQGQVKHVAMDAGSTRRLYEMDKAELMTIDGIGEKYADDIIEKRKGWDISGEYDKLVNSGIRFIPWYSSEYPQRLKAIKGHPFALFCLGDFPDDNRLSVAVVGARNCSQYGRMMASKFGTELAGYGVQVVSGMAYGIDGLAQEAALNAGGTSYAVLGCGVNICYPPSNRILYERLKENGGIISEYGLYSKPMASLFPPRNRIISALSDLVLVIEAREQSGSMITVDMALEQGREVAIVPGRITDPLSTGCMKLCKQGAYPVTSAEDIMYILDENFDNSKKSVIRSRVMLTEDEKRIYEVLEPYAKSIGEITDESSVSFRDGIAALVELCIKGLAAETGKGYYVKAKDCVAV